MMKFVPQSAAIYFRNISCSAQIITTIITKYNPPASSGAAKGKGSGGGMPSRKRVGGDGDGDGDGDDRYEATQEIDFHESEVSKVSDELSAAYVKADKFDGHRDGYVYTRGSRGLGYYTYEGPVNKKLKADTSDSVSGGGWPCCRCCCC